MKDKRLKAALDTQQMKQRGEANTRYFGLHGETVRLIREYRCFIADMHLQHLEKMFEGIDQLNEALNTLEDAQSSIKVRMGRPRTS